MKSEQIKQIEELQTQHTNLINELKELQTKLKETKEKYLVAQKEYSKVDDELDFSEEEEVDIETFRIEERKRQFLVKRNNKLKSKILTCTSTLLSIITTLITLIVTPNITILPLVIAGSVLGGLLVGISIHKKNEKEFLNKVKIEFENSEDYKLYKTKKEEQQQKRLQFFHKKNELSEIYYKLKRECNNLADQIVLKIKEIEEFKITSISTIFIDEIETVKEEFYPKSYIKYSPTKFKNNSKNKTLQPYKR